MLKLGYRYTMKYDVCEKLGRNLRNIRINRKLSIKQLAVISKLNASTILEIENGRGNPLCSTLFKLSKAFRIKPALLVKGI